MSSTVNLGFCEMSVLEPGLVYILFLEDTDVDEGAAVKLLGGILTLTKGEPHAIVYDLNKKDIIIREITRKISGVRDARTANLVCRALVAESLQNKLESKHYIQQGKPSAETKSFTDRNDAIGWAKRKLTEFVGEKPAARLLNKKPE